MKIGVIQNVGFKLIVSEMKMIEYPHWPFENYAIMKKNGTYYNYVYKSFDAAAAHVKKGEKIIWLVIEPGGESFREVTEDQTSYKPFY